MLPAILLAILAGPAVAASIVSPDDCGRAIAEDPTAAREAAAVWSRSGGGVPARLCEAAALEAMGATATAARLLTSLAANPNRAMSTEVRVVTLADGARLWIEAGAPDLAAQALDQADRLGPVTPDREILRARIAAATENWPSALAHLDNALAANPDDARTLALRAAALRLSGEPVAAVVEADRARELAPDLPEALFEAAAARAELGRGQEAAGLWLQLIERHPDDPLAGAARRNLQMLEQESGGQPMPHP